MVHIELCALLPRAFICEYFRVPYFSHLFEIQTASRIYLCGASTHEEMQSWVGILQTLTQYCRQQEIAGVCTIGSKGSSGDEAPDKENGTLCKLHLHMCDSHYTHPVMSYFISSFIRGSSQVNKIVGNATF